MSIFRSHKEDVLDVTDRARDGGDLGVLEEQLDVRSATAAEERGRQSELAAMTRALEALGDRIDRIGARTDALEDAIERVATDHAADIARVAGSIGAVGRILEETAARTDALLRAEVTRVGELIEDGGDATPAVEAQLERIEETGRTHAARIDALGEQVVASAANAIASVASLRRELDAEGMRVEEGIHRQISELSSRVAAFAREQTARAADVALRLEEVATDLSAHTAAVENRLQERLAGTARHEHVEALAHDLTTTRTALALGMNQIRVELGETIHHIEAIVSESVDAVSAGHRTEIRGVSHDVEELRAMLATGIEHVRATLEGRIGEATHELAEVRSRSERELGSMRVRLDDAIAGLDGTMRSKLDAFSVDGAVRIDGMHEAIARTSERIDTGLRAIEDRVMTHLSAREKAVAGERAAFLSALERAVEAVGERERAGLDRRFAKALRKGKTAGPIVEAVPEPKKPKRDRAAS